MAAGLQCKFSYQSDQTDHTNQRHSPAAGTAATGEPLGDGTRLADSYREMVQISGMAGDGPIESEVEEIDGQIGQSQLSAKELYTEYQAVAEQAIESEEIPLSHRFHVKRYFQNIRPEE